VMGGEQAAGVLSEVAAKRFGAAAQNPKMMEGMKKQIAGALDASSEARFCSARMMDDGLIDPRDSRRVLAFALRTCMRADLSELRPNSFGVARL